MTQTASPHEYRTVDSDHPGYVLRRSHWVAPAFLAVFAVASAAVFATMDKLLLRYTEALRWLSGADAATLPVPDSLSFRPFFFLSLVLFAAFVSARWYHRLDLVLRSATFAGATTLGADLLLVRAHELGGPDPFGFGGNVLNGFAMVLVSAAVVLSAHHTPPSIEVATQRRRAPRFAVTLLLTLAAATALVAAVLIYGADELAWLRDYAVLGGLGPGIVLLIPTVQALLFCAALAGRLGSRCVRWLDPREQQPGFSGEPPSVAFLVPAHNEAETIAGCVLSIDRASRGYPRKPRVYVVNNASTDATAEATLAAFERCEHVTGELLDCPTPGKSHALNYGLERISEAILIRVDSDTLLADDVLPRTMRHFRDPSVGGVGGLALPLPSQGETVMGRVRAIEVYHNVGLVRVAQGAADAVMVLPGQLSAYRRQIVQHLGGFAEGINGEDTDLTVRVGRAGWRIVMDPGIRLYSEAPRTIAHLHEQRLRWSRSLVHVYKRNISALRQGQGLRGLWLLPLGLISSVRRAGVPLILIYALTSMAIAPGTLFVRDGVAVLAVLVGPPSVLAVLALVAYRRFDLLPYLPGYFALRLFRTYVSLEALLTMRHKSLPAAVGEAPALRAAATARPQLALPQRGGVTAFAALTGVAFGVSFMVVVVNASGSDAPAAGAPVSFVSTQAEASAQEVGGGDAGAALPVFAGAAPAPASVATAAASRPAEARDAQGWQNEPPLRDLMPRVARVEVAPGDSLARIADRYGSTVETLVRYNRIEDPGRITAGSWLLVPVGSPPAGGG